MKTVNEGYPSLLMKIGYRVTNPSFLKPDNSY